MVHALETKAALVAKRMSTAMFVRIGSMRVSCRNPSIMRKIRIILLDIFLGNMYVQESFTVCMCNKIGVCVCVHYAANSVP